MFKWLTFICLSILLCTGASYAGTCDELGNILGGKADKVDNVCEIFVPRNGIVSTLEGFILDPQIGISLEVSAISIKGNKKKKAFDGEIALFEGEVQFAAALFKANGFDINALHNHFLSENPKIMFMHFEKEGNAVKIATQLRKILNTLGGFNVHRSPLITPSSLNAHALNRVLKLDGQIEPGGVFRADFQRPFKIEDNGATSEPDCMVSIQGSMENALVVGEIALKVNELQRFIKALIQNNLLFTAEHNHEVSEKPLVYYIHFQRAGLPALELATLVRQALDDARIKVEKSGQ